MGADLSLETKRKSGGRSKVRTSRPPVEEFQAIDYSVRGPDFTASAACGEVTISGFWSSGEEVRLPNTVTITVAGVIINKDEALVGDQKSYLHYLRDRIDQVFIEDIQAEGGGQIYNSHKDAVEFSRRFTSLLMRHVRMSAPEFCQVCVYTTVTANTHTHTHTHTHMPPCTSLMRDISHCCARRNI